MNARVSRALPYVLFALRLGLGGTLAAAGIFKAHDGPAATVASVAAYRILPPSLTAPIGIVLPYAELLLAAYLLAGFYARAAAYVASAQLAVFAVAVASLVIRKIPADCGCFGSTVPTPPSWGHVAADVALAALAFVLARFGPGAFALDGPPNGSANEGGEPSAA